MQCVSCGKQPSTLRCTLCRVAVYCSVKCQRACWKQHKTRCNKIQSIRRIWIGEEVFRYHTELHMRDKLVSISSASRSMLLHWYRDKVTVQIFQQSIHTLHSTTELYIDLNLKDEETKNWLAQWHTIENEKIVKKTIFKCEDTCCICCDGAPCKLLPCNHKCVCKECAEKIKTCPMCRDAIIAIDLDSTLETKGGNCELPPTSTTAELKALVAEMTGTLSL